AQRDEVQGDAGRRGEGADQPPRPLGQVDQEAEPGDALARRADRVALLQRRTEGHAERPGQRDQDRPDQHGAPAPREPGTRPVGSGTSTLSPSVRRLVLAAVSSLETLRSAVRGIDEGTTPVRVVFAPPPEAAPHHPCPAGRVPPAPAGPFPASSAFPFHPPAHALSATPTRTIDNSLLLRVRQQRDIWRKRLVKSRGTRPSPYAERPPLEVGYGSHA